MKMNRLALAALFVAAISSCKKENKADVNKATGSAPVAYSISTDASSLSNSIDLSSIGVLELKNASPANLGKVVFNPYPMTQVASVNAPSTSVTASDIELENYAFVSYRDAEKNYAGFIDFINVDNPYAPIVYTRITFPNTDIYSLKKTTGKLFLAGSTDISVNRDLTTGAVFGYYDMDNSGHATSALNAYSVKGDVAFDVDVRLNKAYIVTGPAQFTGNHDSWLVVFNLTTNTVDTSIAITDGRSVAINGTELTILTGTSVKSYNINSFAETKSVANADFPFFTRDIAYDKTNNLLVAAGKEGMKYYNDSRTLIDQITVPSVVPYTIPTDLACYSVSVNNNNVIMAAMGAAGLYVSIADTLGQLSVLGYTDLGGSVVTAIEQDDEFALAATNNGVKIIQLFNNAFTTGWCNYNFYNGLPEFNLTNSTANYGGPAGYQGVVVDNSTYNHCGPIAGSKNFVIVNGGVVNINGNLVQGFTNSIYYLQVASQSNLNINGDLIVYGDLMVEGNINFVGAGHKLRVFGNLFMGNGGTITGTYDDVFGKVAQSNTTKILISGNGATPLTSQGVYINKKSDNAGTEFTFVPIFPRNVNKLYTMTINEGGETTLIVQFATEYATSNTSFTYKKKNGTSVTRTFANTTYNL